MKNKNKVVLSYVIAAVVSLALGFCLWLTVAGAGADHMSLLSFGLSGFFG